MSTTSNCEHEWVMHTYTFAGNPFWEPFGDVFDRCVHCGATRPVSKPKSQRTPHSELRAGTRWARFFWPIKSEWFIATIGGTPPFLRVTNAWNLLGEPVPEATEPGKWLDMEFGPRIEEPE